MYDLYKLKQFINLALGWQLLYLNLNLGYMYDAKTLALNLWVAIPLKGVKCPFHRGHLRPLENTDIYILIYNSSKTTLVK